MHNVFHVSMFRKYLTNPKHIIDYKPSHLSTRPRSLIFFITTHSSIYFSISFFLPSFTNLETKKKEDGTEQSSRSKLHHLWLLIPHTSDADDLDCSSHIAIAKPAQQSIQSNIDAPQTQ